MDVWPGDDDVFNHVHPPSWLTQICLIAPYLREVLWLGSTVKIVTIWAQNGQFRFSEGQEGFQIPTKTHLYGLKPSWAEAGFSGGVLVNRWKSKQTLFSYGFERDMTKTLYSPLTGHTFVCFESFLYILSEWFNKTTVKTRQLSQVYSFTSRVLRAATALPLRRASPHHDGSFSAPGSWECRGQRWQTGTERWFSCCCLRENH